jgi:hypothetical protein
VQHLSLFLRIPLLDTTCFGLTGHLQVYRLSSLRILLLTVMGFSLLLQLPLGILVLWVTRVVAFGFVWFAGCGCGSGVLSCVGQPSYPIIVPMVYLRMQSSGVGQWLVDCSSDS